MRKLVFLPPAAKYLKKLKDKQLKQAYKDTVDRIMENPFLGEEKTGDLKGIRSCDVYYGRTNYELAYTIVDAEEGHDEAIVIVMAGTRENFYEQLKRYWK